MLHDGDDDDAKHRRDDVKNDGYETERCKHFIYLFIYLASQGPIGRIGRSNKISKLYIKQLKIKHEIFMYISTKYNYK